MAPPTAAKVAPPSVENCHWTVGVGEPVAVAVKVAVSPEATVTLDGLVVTVGVVVGTVTVRVAAAVVAVPTELVKTASYS